MNFKKTKVAVTSGLMAASMVLAPLAAYAANDLRVIQPTENTNGVPVSKTVEVAPSGVTLPEETKFHFTATQKDQSTGCGQVFITKLELGVFTTGDSAVLSKEADIALKSEFADAVPGEYVYSLKETENMQPDENGYGWTCDTSEYVMRVYVSSDGTVKYTLVSAAEENEDEKYSLENEGVNDSKLEKATFTNTFTKRGGSGHTDGEDAGDPSLTVAKEVATGYGDMNRYFKFTVKFDVPDTDRRENPTFALKFLNNDEGTFVGEEQVEGSYTNDSESVSLDENTEYVFYLKNGGSVAFDNLPAGTTYTLSEAGVDRYTATMNVKLDGKAGNTIAGKLSEGVTGKNLLIDEGKNEVQVINAAEDITITGVVTHSAPFVIMVGALFVAVGGYVVLKKRIEE